jgi:hypothetical protein
MSTDQIEVEESKKSPASFLDDLAESIEDKNNNPSIWIITLGVVLPALMMVSALVTNHLQLTLLLLKHPIESLCEFILLILVPVANFTTWNSLIRNNFKGPIKRGLLNGMAIATSSLVFLISAVAVLLRYPTHSLDGTKHSVEVGIISIVFLLSASVSVYLAKRVKESRSTESSRKKAMAYVVSGAILSTVVLVAAEAKPTLIRAAEFLAVSELDEDDIWKNRGYQILHFLKPERELTMECANQKSVGISGMFLQIDNVSLRQLYFQLTGKPFREDNSLNFATMPDDYLSKHVVGLPVDGLSLHRSELYGHVNANSASSTFYWTYVFKNRSFEGQEVRAEIGLPEGACVSGMSIWQKDGLAQQTVFSPSVKGQASDRWIEAGHQAPAIVTDLGRDRVLLHCYPVPAQGQLKVALAITAPLKLHTLSDASLCLPHLIDTNFSLKGNHELKILSKESIKTNLKNITASKLVNNENVLSGKLSSQDISDNTMALQVNSTFANSIAAIDYYGNYFTQTITKIPCLAPQNLVVVLDGSCAMSEHLDKIKQSLSHLPAGINASVLVARSGVENYQIEPLDRAMVNLKPEQFTGGQDNLNAVIKASELAGESTNGAVLWIHGPQPSFNKEIYIVSPYVAKPRFFELALDNGIMESHEYFKQHKDVGPFQAISRNGSPAQDLERFFVRWRPGGHEYRLVFAESSNHPNCPMASAEEQSQLIALYAKTMCQSLLEQGQKRLAVTTAVNHQIVSPVSIASSNLEPGAEKMLANFANFKSSNEDNNTDAFKIRPQESGAHSEPARARTITYIDETPKAPTLQCISNGTIGPQGSDCTFGVDTAGTVRANNLANLEALLNVFANSVQVLAILWGAITLASCSSRYMPSKYDQLLFGSTSKIARINYAIIAFFAGLSMPSVVNFLVASARDANLFS